MKLISILPKEAISIQLSSRDSGAVLRELAQLLHRADPSLNPETIFTVLQEREKLGSTGIGSGVAIPHGKLAGAKRILACFGRSREGVDFQSQDGEPAYLFFALIAPENAAGMHLKALAKLSRLLKDGGFRDRLLAADSSEEIYRILAVEDDKM